MIMDRFNNTTAATNCSNPTVEKEKAVLVLYSTFSAISVLVYLTTIVLIVKARAFRAFLHRLTLYLAIGGILRSLAYMLQVLPVDVNQPDSYMVALRKGWDGVCVFGGFMVQYASFLQALTVTWSCFYLVGLVVYQKQLNKRNHELAGLITISLAPFLFTWEPFITNSYGLLGTRCWIADADCGSDYDVAFIYQMAINVAPNFLLSLLSLILLAFVIVFLARRAVKKVLELHHWFAIKEVLPLGIYPFLYTLVVLGRLLALVIGTYTPDVGHAFMALSQLCSLTLPLSLLLRSSVRRSLCRRKAAEKEPLATTTFEEDNYGEKISLI